MSKDGWEEGFAAKAKAYWTDERTAELVRDKALAVTPAEAAPLLRALGLLHRDASMPPTQHRKFFQVNHMVRLLEGGLRTLRAKHPTIHLLDAGCGRSYLSLVLAWVAREVWGHPLEVYGIDHNAAIIDECRRRAELAGLDDVARFGVDRLDALISTHNANVHGVLALHACDTATCDAIAVGVACDAELIAVAPCCQAELARGWSGIATPGAFAPIWRTPHLRRETAAHVTDTMRALLLRAVGYDVTAVEFVPGEHTRKNTLIRAVRRGTPDAAAKDEYLALRDATGGVGLALAERLHVA